MFLSDFHTHVSPFSPDASDSILDMAEAAYRKGLSQLCITDHIDDCCAPETGSFPPSFFKYREERLSQFLQARERLGNRITLHLGIELAALNQMPETAKKIVAAQELDFIIGSCHNIRDGQDLYWMKFESEAHCRRIYRDYIKEYQEMVELDMCDVLAHIGYPHRYMYPQGFNVDIMENEEQLRALFTAAVQHGVGIEINTSGLRNTTRRMMPHLPVIQLYRACGGEIITTGSDAHNTRDVGAGIRDACELMRQAGFRYVTVYNRRKPEFIRID